MRSFTASFAPTDGAVTLDGLMDGAKLALDVDGFENVDRVVSAVRPLAEKTFMVTVSGQSFLASLPRRSALRIAGDFKAARLKLIVPKTHVAEALAAVAILDGEDREFSVEVVPS